MAIWDLSHAHDHEHEGPQYPYMHIRTKDYPWGACTLFDKHCWGGARKEDMTRSDSASVCKAGWLGELAGCPGLWLQLCVRAMST